jgi:hypothetical protein
MARRCLINRSNQHPRTSYRLAATSINNAANQPSMRERLLILATEYSQ